MQIHELNTYVGTPDNEDYLAIDNGDETLKIGARNLGVTTKMTKAEAIAGTETEPRVLQPSVFHDVIETLNPNPTYYGTCSTTASTSTKVVVCPEFVLKTGAMIAVEFTNKNTATGTLYLNVNSTGAKRIRKTASSTDSVSDMWDAGGVIIFVYDGASWIIASTIANPTVSETFPVSRTGGAAGATVDTSLTKFVRNGKVVSGLLAITAASAAVDAGANIFTGTLNNEKMRPAAGTGGRLIGYLGSRAIVCQLGDTGSIVVRNTSPTSLTMGGSVYLGGTYLID